jgi:hypothetical protein
MSFSSKKKLMAQITLFLLSMSTVLARGSEEEIQQAMLALDETARGSGGTLFPDRALLNQYRPGTLTLAERFPNSRYAEEQPLLELPEFPQSLGTDMPDAALLNQYRPGTLTLAERFPNRRYAEEQPLLELPEFPQSFGTDMPDTALINQYRPTRRYNQPRRSSHKQSHRPGSKK